MIPQPTGHARILESLADLADRDRLPHALLFTGPEGIGKSLAAHWLAARMLCTADAARPCGTCRSCKQVAARTHPDVAVVERPANKKETGIDLIRNLKHFVRLRAVAGRQRIAIVDDADRLTIAAQNALLKTLEEPPGGAIVILVAAITEALLPTVRSRCRRVRFPPLAVEQVAAVLESACGISRDEAGSLLAWAEGSPGRALRMREVLAGTAWKELEGALAEVRAGSYCLVVRLAHKLAGTEEDMGIRLERLLHAYRDAAATALAARPSAPSDTAFAVDPDEAVRAAEIISGALRTLRRRSPNRPLLGEAVALRLARC